MTATLTQLSATESALLRYMVNSGGQVVSRDELLARVWKMNPHGQMTRTVDMTIARLREKIRDTGEPPIIETVRGKGLCIPLPETSRRALRRPGGGGACG